MPGPAPKRAAERRRTNTPAAGDPRILDVEALPDDDPASLPFKIRQPVVPPGMDPDWDPLVKEMWESFHSSGSAMFWEPSDWVAAKLMCESLSRDLGEQVVGVTPMGDAIYARIPLKGASLASYAKLMSMLMLTEADRRRAGLEVKRDRVGAPAKLAPVVSVPEWRKQLLGKDGDD